MHVAVMGAGRALAIFPPAKRAPHARAALAEAKTRP